MPDIADAHAMLGTVTNYEGVQLPVFRDHDALDLCAVTVLLPAGVTELEARIADYRNAVARCRLREFDFDSLGVDLDEARDDLADIPGLADPGDPRNLELVDWNKVARRLHAMREYVGHAELRKLSALLMADEVPATEATS